MISNYLKLAWRVLGRKKFFTFISLFGISFTLSILMFVVSYLQTELGSQAPMGNISNLVTCQTFKMQRIHYDTIPQIDSTLTDNVIVYDTTFTTKKAGKSMSNSDFSGQIIDNYFSDISSAEMMTKVHMNNSDVFINNSKIIVESSYVNASFWSMFNFEFEEGAPFTEKDNSTNNPIMVITKQLAKKYFGFDVGVVGKELNMDGKAYKIVGVIADPKVSSIGFGGYVSRDAYMPISNMPDSYTESFYFGGFKIIFKKKDGVPFSRMTEDLKHAGLNIPLDHPDNKDYDFNEVLITPYNYKTSYAYELYYDEDPEKSLSTMRLILFSLIGLFILLPLLNLINLNVSRIMDRSSEIGVRKAFGANQSNILFQFVFENVVLTFIGGAIGLLVTLIGFNLLNESHVLGTIQLEFNLRFFIGSVIVTLLFGVMSGLLPAFKMSKLSIVNALKENKL